MIEDSNQIKADLMDVVSALAALGANDAVVAISRYIEMTDVQLLEARNASREVVKP